MEPDNADELLEALDDQELAALDAEHWAEYQRLKVAALRREILSRNPELVLPPAEEPLTLQPELKAYIDRRIARGDGDKPFVFPDSLPDPNGTPQQQTAARRQAAIDPLLKDRGWTVYRWEKVAGVASKVGQRYFDGETTPRIEQAQKLAKALDLPELPL